MKLSVGLKQVGLKIHRMFAPVIRYHSIISFVLIMSVLISAIFMVNNILNQPPDQAYEDEKKTKSVRFDEATITQLDRLRSSDQDSSLSLPGDQRINPFAE